MENPGPASALTLRAATPEDAPSYAACHIACWQEAYADMVSADFLISMAARHEAYAAHYQERLAAPGERDYLCVLDEGRMVGFVIINRGAVAGHPGAREIWAIYLRKAYWGRGHGQGLLDYAVEQLRPLGASAIFLWVFEENHRARRFYEKNGFHFDGTVREADYGDPMCQLRYTLTLL